MIFRICGITLVTITALALALSGPGKAQDIDEPETFAEIDTLQSGVSSSVQSLSARLDDFLSNREFQHERNDTSVRLRFELDASRDPSPDFRVYPRLRLRLPNTQRILLIDVGANPDNSPPQSLENGSYVDPEDQDSDLAIRLRHPRNFGKTRVTPEVGLGWSDGEPFGFVGGRLSRGSVINDTTLLYGYQHVRYRDDRGWEATTYGRVDRSFGRITMLRGELKLRWREDRSGFGLRPGVIVQRRLGEKAVGSWENYLNLDGGDKIERDSVYVGLRYRRLVYKDWLFGELAPWVGSESSDDFETDYGLQVRLDIDF